MIGYFAFFLSAILSSVDLADARVKPSRIGVLGASEEPRFSEIVAGLKRGLRELGYTDKTIEIVEGRVPRGDNARRSRPSTLLRTGEAQGASNKMLDCESASL